jgi:Ca-activated chloride channel family protein
MNELNFTLTTGVDRTLFWEGGDSVRYLVARLNAAKNDDASVTKRAPLNIALVIDASGSMGGGKLAAAQMAAIGLVERLSADDRISVVSFAQDVVVHIDGMAAGPDNLSRIRSEISSIQTRGMTFLSGGYFAGVECAASVVADDPTMTPRVLLLSDGHANRGLTDPNELFEHVGQLRQRGVLTSTLGIGDGYDEHLLRGMAEHGGGRLHDAELTEEITSVLHGELDDITLTVIEDAKLNLTFPDSVQVELLGTLPHVVQGNSAEVVLGPVQNGVERVVVFKMTCPLADIFLQQLDFTITASGQNVETSEALSVGPNHVTLTAASGAENNAQSRDNALAAIVARIWSAHIIATAARFNRDAAYREAEKFAAEQVHHFGRYVRDLEGADDMVRELRMLAGRVGRRMSSRSTKEMYLHSSRVSSSRMDHRGEKPSWSERLDDDR